MEPEIKNRNKAVCTVTTLSHMAPTLALAESVINHFTNCSVHIFIIDKNEKELPPPNLQHVYYHYGNNQQLSNYLAPFIKKYGKDSDFLRWALKPVLMKYLLVELGADATCFIDNDIFFFENADFLFDQLKANRFLLSPHWRIKDPAISEPWFNVNFKDGMFNGGFVGATTEGLEILDWWAKACLFACEIKYNKGRRGAQKYLDLVPAEFENVGIIRHRGCNVAYWNQYDNKREPHHGKVLINGQWPIIFIHFTGKLIKDIKSGKDMNLRPYLKEYQQVVSYHK